jgi:uncharacterized Tic20 family protein
MEKSSVSKNTVAFGVALAICSVLNVLLVMVKEKSPAVQAAMKKMTGHHWVTHAVVIVTLFILLGWVLGATKKGGGPAISTNGLIKIMVAGIFTAGGLIIGFYLIAG